MSQPASFLTPPTWIPLRFTQHYHDWRDARVAAVREYYGDGFFAGRTLLELGCGYGDIGAQFAALGAQVTCSDGRAEHLAVLRDRWPALTVIPADLDREWPFGHFDVICTSACSITWSRRTPASTTAAEVPNTWLSRQKSATRRIPMRSCW